MIEVHSIDEIPTAGEEDVEIAVVRPKRFFDLLSPSKEWRAQCCTELLARGWVDIRATNDRVTARSSRAPC